MRSLGLVCHEPLRLHQQARHSVGGNSDGAVFDRDFANGDAGLNIAQKAPMRSRYRVSSESAWPIRRADGTPFHRPASPDQSFSADARVGTGNGEKL